MTIPEFTAHNIRLDDGSYTKPESALSMESFPWFVSAQRLINALYPGVKSGLRVADLGCLEGGYAVEFARMGMQTLGIEARTANLEACNYVKAKTNLPNLKFVRDDALNIAKYGSFDIVFCCGLLYHLDQPKNFLKTLFEVTKKLLIVQTHFASASGAGDEAHESNKFKLSAVTENEGLPGRWYPEFADDASELDRENSKWASWENNRSFWIQREFLLQAIHEAGFDIVMEQFDNLGSDIGHKMIEKSYRDEQRGTFIGMRSEYLPGQLL